MRKKRHTPEEIVSKLRQVDVLVPQGTPVAEAIRAIGVTEVGRDRKLATAPTGALDCYERERPEVAWFV